MIDKIIGQEISVNVPKNMKAQVIPQGNSYQATREGYNLVKASNKFRKGNCGNGIIDSVTTEGYLQIIAEEGNENWYNSFWSLDGQESINKIKDILKVGDTFTIAFTIKRTEGTSKAPTVYIKEYSPYKTMLSSVSTNFSQVYYTGIWEDGFDISIIHLGFANLTGTFIIKDWMVKKGNIAEWQEYGVMPSLNYPSEVEAVGDNINIFDNTVETVTSTINDNGIEVPDAATNDYYKQIIIPDSKKYIMSYKKNNQSFVRMAYYNGDTFISRQYSNQNGFIFTVPDNCNKIDCRTNAGTNNGIKFTDLKIERGEVATSYSLYNQGNIEITNSNKNLLDLGQVSAKGITFNKNRITIINPTYYLYAEKCNLINNKFLSGKSLTLTLIANGNVETNNMAINMGTNKDGYRFQKYFTVGNYDNTKFVITKTLQEDEHITYINVYVPTTALPTCNLTIDLQMEINEASDFIEHKGNTYTLPIQKPFYKIGDYTDKFIKQNNKWYEQHYIKEYDVTGNESWTFQKNVGSFYKYQCARLIGDKLNILNAPLLCNYFEQITVAQSDGADLKEGIANGLYPDYSIMFLVKNLTTLDDFKAKLQELYNAGNPIKLYYILATPELIECTEEQSQILEQLNNLYLYEGINYLYSTDDLSPIFEFSYDKIINDFKFYLSENGRLIFPNENISFLCSISESSIPSMPEALETSATIAGRDGDVPLNTTYGPLSFELILYTEDNLTPEEKLKQEIFLNRFCNSIKNNTETFALELAQKFYKIKYNGLLNKENYPKFLKFTLPFKSSKSFAYDVKKNTVYGNNTFESNTIEPTGFKCIIKGPALKPIISLNDYSIEYDNTILKGESLIIDTNNSTAILVSSDGTETNAMRYYNHQFSKILNGENELKILSGIDSPENVSISWYDLTL